MNTSELVALTAWIDEQIVGKKIVKLYQNLVAVLQQNLQPNQQKSPFEVQRDSLLQGIRSIKLEALTGEQRNALIRFGIGEYVGGEGVATVENILFRNTLDLATAANHLQKITKAIESGVSRSNQIRDALKGVLDLEDYELRQEVLLRIKFSGNAPISNVVDLRNWADVWFDIGRGIAMANGVAPETVRVVGASRGSIIIDLAVIYGVAWTVSEIILMALEVAKRSLQVKREAEEIRALKLKNDRIVALIEDEIESEKKSRSEEIAQKMIEKLELSRNGNGDIVNVLEKATRRLVDFVERGGEVDVVPPKEIVNSAEEEVDPVEPQKLEELKGQVEKIRLAEKEIRLLEHKAHDSTGDE